MITKPKELLTVPYNMYDNYCGGCGRKNIDDDKYCRECGYDMHKQTAKPLFPYTHTPGIAGPYINTIPYKPMEVYCTGIEPTSSSRQAIQMASASDYNKLS